MLFIRPAAAAIKKRYIQQNTPWELKWLVYDIDRPTASIDWLDGHAPSPNIIAMNPENGHAHFFYGLKVPVLKDGAIGARQRPLRYAASIDVALSRLLEADPGYSGLICKNPLHNYWNVQEWLHCPYDLPWLADYLDLEPYRDARRHLPEIGLGRNCTLFDVTRRRAYAMRRSACFLNVDFFVWEVTQYAARVNAEFLAPLPFSEVKATGKSIGKWTWANMSPQGFWNWGERRRVKSILVRKARSASRADNIRAYKAEHPEATTRQMGKIFGVNFNTISRALRESKHAVTHNEKRYTVK
jgi:hypothetical protein